MSAAERHRTTILSFIQSRGYAGATCDEVEENLGLLHQTASARIRELKNSMLIETTGIKRLTRNDRPADVLFRC